MCKCIKMIRWCIGLIFISVVWSAPSLESLRSLRNSRIPKKLNPRNTCSCECGMSNRQQRIVGGEEAKPHEFPWLVGLKTDETFHCGASLITNRHVLTAAHCVNGFDTNKLRAVLADHDRKSSSRKDIIVERRVRHARMHIGFDASNYNNDIAVLELDRPVDFSTRIQPVCLPRSVNTNYTNRAAIIAGWGRTEERGNPSTVLKKVSVPVWSREECLDAGYQKKKITQNMFCAGYKEGKLDACQGDSGGPLHISNDNGSMEVIGLISWGRGCARKNLPGVYTKIVNYLEWIDESLGGECVCSPAKKQV